MDGRALDDSLSCRTKLGVAAGMLFGAQKMHSKAFLYWLNLLPELDPDATDPIDLSASASADLRRLTLLANGDAKLLLNTLGEFLTIDADERELRDLERIIRYLEEPTLGMWLDLQHGGIDTGWYRSHTGSLMSVVELLMDHPLVQPLVEWNDAYAAGLTSHFARSTTPGPAFTELRMPILEGDFAAHLEAYESAAKRLRSPSFPKPLKDLLAHHEPSRTHLVVGLIADKLDRLGVAIEAPPLGLVLELRDLVEASNDQQLAQFEAALDANTPALCEVCVRANRLTAAFEYVLVASDGSEDPEVESPPDPH